MFSRSLVPSYMLQQPQQQQQPDEPEAGAPSAPSLSDEGCLEQASGAIVAVTTGMEIMEPITERTEEFSSFERSAIIVDSAYPDHAGPKAATTSECSSRLSPQEGNIVHQDVCENNLAIEETAGTEELSGGNPLDLIDVPIERAMPYSHDVGSSSNNNEITAAQNAAQEDQGQPDLSTQDSVSAMLPPLPPTHHLQPLATKRYSLPHSSVPVYSHHPPPTKKSGIPTFSAGTGGGGPLTRRASMESHPTVISTGRQQQQQQQQLQPPVAGGARMGHRRSSSTQSLTSAAPTAGTNTVTSATASGSGSNGSLLALPLASQLHSLKARNAQLESTLTSLNKIDSNDLFRAKQRISNLEEKVKELEPLKIEAEGWESEAKGLMTELEKVKQDLEQAQRDAAAAVADEVSDDGDDDEEEKAAVEEALRSQLRKSEKTLSGEREKKRRYKEIGARLRAELIGRRWREKWELGIMDGEDRQRDIAMVGLEYDLAISKMNLGFEKIQKEETQEVVEQQQRKISELTASRSILLDSTNEAQENITNLRETVATLQKDTSALTRARLDLKKFESSLRSSNDQTSRLKMEKEDLESVVERLEVEIESVRAEVDSLRDGRKGEKGETREKESKVIESLKKALERERERRERAEEKSEKYKSSLEEAQINILNAQSTSAKNIEKPSKLASRRVSVDVVNVSTAKGKRAADISLAKTVAVKPVSSPAVNLSKSLHVEQAGGVSYVVEEEEIPGEPDSEEEDQATPVKAPPKTISRLQKSQKKEAATRIRHLSPAFSASEAEDEETYKPVKSKSRSKPMPARKKRKSDEGELEFNPAAVKKKADKKMLADKSTNGIADGTASTVINMGVGKKNPALSNFEEGDTTITAEEPAKKKKRKLFGGPKKFEWGSIENMDVNSLGLPSKLSPIKGASSVPLSKLGLLGQPRKNIFA